jgi:hypothetical protein
MKKALLLFLAGFCVLAAGAQTITGALTASDPKFTRPDKGTPPVAPLSVEGVNVSYDLIPIVVTAPGLLTFVSFGSPNLDTYGFLYSPAGFNAANPLANVLVGDDDSGPGTYNFAITYNFPAAGTYYLVVTSFKPGALGTYTITTNQGGPLPVRLVSLTAEKTNGGKNLIKWVAAGESDIAKYQVQHSSDGSKYTDIAGGTVVARNAATNTSYSYTDNAPYQKFNYYRLKIYDVSGLITTSIVVVVNNGGSRSAIINIFPNPAVEFLNIQTKAGQRGKAVVSVASAGGQIVYQSDYTIAEGGIINLDVKKLSSGSYFVRIATADGETTNLPFVKH